MDLMSTPDPEAFNMAKRVGKFFRFQKFAGPGCPVNPTGPFRDNILVFLREAAELADYCVGGMPTWLTLLAVERFVIPLYIVEERVENSPRTYCDHCRRAGWTHDFVSEQYHIIIPAAAGEWNKPLQDGFLYRPTHILHGILHGNGFGHLLSINEIEGRSKFLQGKGIMDLWDRICTNLRSVKVTVADVLKKHSMDLRLLCGVAYGQSWFGQWGYKFCNGSCGVVKQEYETAIKNLSSLQLDVICHDFRKTTKYTAIKHIIRRYRCLSESSLITLNDLLRYMLSVMSQAPAYSKSVISAPASYSCRPPGNAAADIKFPAKNKSRKHHEISSVVDRMGGCRWSAKRLEETAAVVVNALKERRVNKSDAMTRSELRDAVHSRIGDTGLIDHVLKSINNVRVGKYIVRRAMSSSKRILEFTVERAGNGERKSEPETEFVCAPILLDEADVKRDLIFLYRNVMLDYPKEEPIRWAAQTILECQLLVKEWAFNIEDVLLREDGGVNRSVKCQCGVQDEDGERMVACDLCNVYQHKRCAGFQDSQPVPPLFVCRACCASVVPEKSEQLIEFDGAACGAMPPFLGHGAELLY